MLNRIMDWVQSKRIIISSLVIAVAYPGNVDSGYISVNSHVINIAKLASHSWILNRLFTAISLWILLHICQWIFHLIRRA